MGRNSHEALRREATESDGWGVNKGELMLAQGSPSGQVVLLDYTPEETRTSYPSPPGRIQIAVAPHARAGVGSVGCAESSSHPRRVPGRPHAG